MKQLIINADDFGFTRDVNAGIVHAHCEGVLTSTTLMANGDAFEDAVRRAHEVPTLDVGCHLVLVQGYALTTGQPFPETPKDVVKGLLRGGFDVYAELRAQIERIIEAGIRPTHLDSHKHTHIMPGVFRKVVRLAQEFSIPYVRLAQEFSIPYVRLPLDRTTPYAGWICAWLDPFYRRFASRRGVHMTDHFVGYRLTGTLEESSFLASLNTLGEGTTEFMCHPGFLENELQAAPTRLKESRVRELEALVSPRLRRFIDEAGVRLATFDNATPRRP